MIYLDYHATTPLDLRVKEAMRPYWDELFANPSSATHALGRTAAAAVTRAREQVAQLLACSPGEIVFTSGATEANNLAVLGTARADPRGRRRIVISSVEHKAILEPAAYLARQGYDVVRVPVDQTAVVDKDFLRRAVDDNTLLVSIHAANNEVGTLQDILEIAEIAHAHGAWMHTDATQAVGKIDVDVLAWQVDLLSFSAHKFYGPKGIGGLFRLGGRNGVPMEPLQWGGGQEGDVRPGTLNVPGIVGLGMAAEIAMVETPAENERVRDLRNSFEADLLHQCPEVRVNGNLNRRLPGNSSLSFMGVDGAALLAHVPELALSMGSACTSGALEPSYVLTSMGLSRQVADSTIRVGLGRFTTATEVSQAVEQLTTAYRQLTHQG